MTNDVSTSKERAFPAAEEKPGHLYVPVHNAGSGDFTAVEQSEQDQARKLLLGTRCRYLEPVAATASDTTT